MRKIGEAARSAREQLRRKANELETQALAAEGRRSVKAKAKTTVKVARRAAKAGAVAAVVTAVAVVAREVRKRRKANA
jgi:hypothetical protein